MTHNTTSLARPQRNADLPTLITHVLDLRPSPTAETADWMQHVQALEELDMETQERIREQLLQLAALMSAHRDTGEPTRKAPLTTTEQWIARAEELEARVMVLSDGLEDLEAMRRQLTE